MAKAGDVIDNPLTGERFVVHKSAGETNGELLEGDVHVAAHAAGPPDHVHPVCEERFKMISGRMRIKIDGEQRTVAAGDEVVISPGTAHKFWNDGEEEAAFHLEVRPALRVEVFLETLFGLARDGKTSKSGEPNLLQVAVLMREYSEELRAAFPPPIVQTALLGVVAPIGRLFGYKARYPEYSGEE